MIEIEETLPHELGYRVGFQAGLKRAAKIAEKVGAKMQYGTEGKSKDWYVGVADVREKIHDCISGYIAGDREASD